MCINTFSEFSKWLLHKDHKQRRVLAFAELRADQERIEKIKVR